MLQQIVDRLKNYPNGVHGVLSGWLVDLQSSNFSHSDSAFDKIQGLLWGLEGAGFITSSEHGAATDELLTIEKERIMR